MQHNFIDEALQGHGSADDFLQAMAEIYAFPEVREELPRYPLWVSDVIAVIDYDILHFSGKAFGGVQSHKKALDIQL